MSYKWIRKTFASDDDAERFRERLYERYNTVRMITCYQIGPTSWAYTWECIR